MARTVMLSPEQSFWWEEGHWSAWRVEEDILELLIAADVLETVIVLLDTGAVAFAVSLGEVLP
jgi:hypothetical protein